HHCLRPLPGPHRSLVAPTHAATDTARRPSGPPAAAPVLVCLRVPCAGVSDAALAAPGPALAPTPRSRNGPAAVSNAARRRGPGRPAGPGPHLPSPAASPAPNRARAGSAHRVGPGRVRHARAGGGHGPVGRRPAVRHDGGQALRGPARAGAYVRPTGDGL